MGQAWLIVNLDKQEYFDPDELGSGTKLAEILHSSHGGLTALGVLLASPTENGQGGTPGDVCRHVCSRAGSDLPTDWEPVEGERIYEEWQSVGGNNQHRLIVPTLVGRWAGDRVIFAGEYGRPGENVEDPALLVKSIVMELNDARRVACIPDCDKNNVRSRTLTLMADYNLYFIARYFLPNITRDLIRTLSRYRLDGNDQEHIECQLGELLAETLRVEYTPRLRSVVRQRDGQIVGKWNLHWMCPETLELFLLRNESPGSLAARKAWLRKQDLLPWQREILTWYRTPLRKTRLGYAKIMSKYGLLRSYATGYKFPYPPLLPSHDRLVAALHDLARSEHKNEDWERFLPPHPYQKIDNTRTRPVIFDETPEDTADPR